MFEKILLPLDGSEMAEIAIPYAEELASRLGSEVILYHVCGREHQQQKPMHQAYLNRLAVSMQNSIKKSQLKSSDVKVITKVEAGEPAGNICNLVNNNKVDLIIMAAISASGLKVGKMVGSVADHICRTVPIPVMLIRPQSVQKRDPKQRLINHVLIPLDGSELSKLALPVGEELVSQLGVSATIFQMANMVRLYDDGSGTGAYIDYTKLNEYEKRRVTTEMIALEKTLKERGLSVTQVVTSGFDAAYEIIELCRKMGIDLVVMSTHGRSGITRWVLGNVAEKVLRHGETPLLLVHARAG